MTKRNATWWNPLTWMAGKAAPPLRPSISIDERQIAIAKRGDLVIVTMPERIKPIERRCFRDYAHQMEETRGIRFCFLDGGCAVTVVRSAPQ